MASRGFRGAMKFNRNESQIDRSLEPESDQVLDSGAAGNDGDRNILVENDHLQMQNPHSRPSGFARNLSSIDKNESSSGSSPMITPTRSNTDLPNTVGNTARRDNGTLMYSEVQHDRPVEFEQHHTQQRKQWWESNYKEAAIFLEEGENNDKFSHHPRSYDHLPAYLLVHNKWFNFVDLSAALILLCLGFVEEPCLQKLQVPVQVHGAIELCALVLIGVQVALKTRWIGWRTFMLHKRTAIKVLTLIIMIMEALVVLVHSRNHFRITRSLRPIFLVDNHFCGGVRRFTRQILQSLPPILDMLALVCFVMLIYSKLLMKAVWQMGLCNLLFNGFYFETINHLQNVFFSLSLKALIVFGFYFFGDQDPDNFQTLSKSFVSLFVLLTTANYPDVMMKSYNWSRWSAVFFISYLAINLYFLMNLMLAVVYDAFTRIEKEKFRRLFIHKRKAAQHAFKLLVTQERQEEVSFQHFEGLLRSYKPSAGPTEAYLIFKTLNKSNSGYLNKEEFNEVYDACRYSWNLGRSPSEWYHDMRPAIRRCLSYIHKAVTSTWFEYTICMAVLTNGVVLIVQTALMHNPSDDNSSIYSPWVTYFFVTLYTVEACIKLLGMGPTQYFASYWNTFDFCVTILGILALILEIVGIPLSYVIILRPLRLLTLFRMKKRFRDVFGTAVILLPRLMSAVIVLLLTYYFFAIIGMEVFGDLNLQDCCINSTVEQFYSYVNGSNNNQYYWLNNFASLPSAGVTLFELTVVNNWFIIMEGYAISSGTEWSRAFFMIFYIFTMIVMTIIVAFILEAFLFRIQFKEFLTKSDEIKKLTTEVSLTSEELEMLVQKQASPAAANNHSTSQQQRLENGIRPNSTYKFVGHKSRTKEQLQTLMYCEEMENWLAEERLEEARSQARLAAALLRNSQNHHDADDQNTNALDNGSMVQVVEDEDEVTTIRRPVLPDVRP